MKKKLGLFGENSQDENLINNLLLWMNKNKADYTNTFISLMNKNILKEKLFQSKEFVEWYQQWQQRLRKNKETTELSLSLMRTNNPLVIPRNHKIEESLHAASFRNDLLPIDNLLKVLKKPYKDRSEISDYQIPPLPGKNIYQTFCGT